MPYRDHHQLIVYQKAKVLTMGVLHLVQSLPRTHTLLAIVNQLIRSCSSIGANIAEGYGRKRF